MPGRGLDCIVIGYNETPFGEYERLLRRYGEDSEAYRDLHFSFVELDGEKLTYPGLLNHVLRLPEVERSRASAVADFKSGDIPNLAAAYLTSFLRRQGFRASYVNLFQDEKAELEAWLDQDPLCVAITTTFYVLNFPVNEMVEFIRRRNDRVKIVVGGPLVANHVRNLQGEELAAALGDMGADYYVVDSQGELTLSRIVAALASGRSVAEVPNLIYFEAGRLRETPHEVENNSLDENIIDWGIFADARLGRTLQTRTARSCAFSCSFCNYPTRAGKLTLASLDAIERELDSMHALGVKNLVFIDDTFNVPLPRFKDICRLMIRKEYGFDWFSYFRCSNSDDEAIELLAQSGCKGVFLGIESGSPAILKNMNKAATLDQYRRGIDRLHKLDVITFGSFIVGFPGETDETVEETISFIRDSAFDYYRTQIWYCEPGTPIDMQRDKYKTTGEGFVWEHATMDSLTAMDHIDRIFLSVSESCWLPQWSFDFWIIPYLLGRGMSRQEMKGFVDASNKLLALDIASVAGEEKRALQRECLGGMARMASGWRHLT